MYIVQLEIKNLTSKTMASYTHGLTNFFSTLPIDWLYRLQGTSISKTKKAQHIFGMSFALLIRSNYMCRNKLHVAMQTNEVFIPVSSSVVRLLEDNPLTGIGGGVSGTGAETQSFSLGCLPGWGCTGELILINIRQAECGLCVL